MSAGDPLLRVSPGDPQKAPKFTFDQTNEVPLETNFKCTGTTHKVQNGPCQTNFLLQRARQTSPGGPKNHPRSNEGGTTWNQFQMKRYVTQSTEWPMQDKLSAAKGLPDTPQIRTTPTFLQLTQSKHKEYHLKPIPNEEVHHPQQRMAHARQIVCCKRPARHAPVWTPRPLSYYCYCYNWPRVNIKCITWNQFQLQRYVPQRI